MRLKFAILHPPRSCLVLRPQPSKKQARLMMLSVVMLRPPQSHSELQMFWSSEMITVVLVKSGIEMIPAIPLLYLAHIFVVNIWAVRNQNPGYM